MVTQERLKQLLLYNPDTGEFLWLKGRRKGRMAGCKHSNGYYVIVINSKGYPAHVLAWVYMTGNWPTAEIDHKNRVRHDNKFENLREASKSQQRGNVSIQKRNKLGIRGVRKAYGGKFETRIESRRGGIRKYEYIGTFSTVEEAKNAYDNRAREIYGEFYNN